MPLEELKGIIEKNKNLTSEIKDNILSLCKTFTKTFPSVSLGHLKKNLEDLKIEKVSKHVTNEYAYYVGQTNTLYINYKKISDDDDVKHIMMHQLLNIITFNGSFSGFNENNFLKALNIGFTEILTNNLVGNDGDVSYYDDEVVATNLLSDIVGFETLLKAYFENNSNLVLQSLIEVGG